jgi:hypothetical protein
MPRKFPFADAAVALDEPIAHLVAEAERVVDVLPVGAAEEERLSVFHLPLEQPGLHAPPWIEVNVFDASDVVDGIDEDAASQRLAVHVANEVPVRYALRRSRCRG